MPRSNPVDRFLREMLEPIIDGLVKADDDERRAAAIKIQAIAAVPVFRALLHGLLDRAKRATAPEDRSGAILSLMRLGTPGVMLVAHTALQSRATPWQAAAVEFLTRYGRTLPQAPRRELYFALLTTRAKARDPSVVAVCAELLSALDTEEASTPRAPVSAADPTAAE